MSEIVRKNAIIEAHAAMTFANLYAKVTLLAPIRLPMIMTLASCIETAGTAVILYIYMVMLITAYYLTPKMPASIISN